MEPKVAIGEPARYPVALEVKYRTHDRKPSVGMGRTSWMSNREVVFTTDQPIQDGTRLEISIAWPALLNERVALQLVVEGAIVASAGKKTTARILKHHFRTRGPWHREEKAPRAALVYALPPQPPHEEIVCLR